MESLIEFLSHREVRAAIERERETRHWTIAQRREALGENWPSESARITREADAAADWLSEALEQLRSAWNYHFNICPDPVANIPAPTLEQVQVWLNAPSDTASA